MGHQEENLTPGEPMRFTKRQREVLRLLAASNTDQEIALALGIVPQTVRKHTRHLRRKLGLESRTELAIWAAQAGFGKENM